MPDPTRVFAVSDDTSSSVVAAPSPTTEPASVQIATIVAAVFLAMSALAVAYVSGDKTLLSTVVSAVVAASMILFNFQYGSSAGSQRKDAVIAAKAGVSK